MRFTITLKLLFVFLATTGAVLIAALMLARWSFNQSFLDYVNALEHDRLSHIAADVAQQYDADRGTFVDLDPRSFIHIVQIHSPRGLRDDRRPPSPSQGHHPGFGRPKPGDEPGRSSVALFDVAGKLIVGRSPTQDNDLVRVPVISSGVTVGELRALPHRRFTTLRETEFAQQQRTATWVIAIVCTLLALGISMIVARTLQASLRRAMQRVNHIAAGDFTAKSPELRSDEFGELSANLERLATTLEENRKSRQRWLADISHELRTPVTVLVAELHALKDGIRTLDAAQIESFDQEVKRLQHLIDDLYQLSLSEIGGLRYAFAPVDLSELLHASEPERISTTLVIQTHIEPGLAVRGDATRLDQLFTNLWRNALAYTDSPGVVRLTAARSGANIRVVIEDSLPGVAAEHLEKLFDPLFRTELSRSRKLAGAGLGLAICRNIITAHEGTVRSVPSSLGGLAIQMEFPAL